jgi:elongation factor P--(R)-beta-lysine ligase
MSTSLDRNFVPGREVFEARNRFYAELRKYFAKTGVLEVETPIAVLSPGLEPHLLALGTRQHLPDGSSVPLFLHTSPEYAMKRLIGRGLGSIFQLARVFRDGELSATHAPEFTMLEWYRAPGCLADLVRDLEVGIVSACASVDGPWIPQGVLRISVSEAFLAQDLPDPLAHPETADFRRALEGIRSADDDTWADLFHRALLERVEPSFPPDHLTVLEGYPASMAALARIDPKDPRRAERFEVYAGSMELANAFGELTDPVEQRRRFESDLADRSHSGLPPYPIDEGLLEDLGQMPETAGIALGVDRLLMRCLGFQRIQDVLAFSPREGAI